MRGAHFNVIPGTNGKGVARKNVLVLVDGFTALAHAREVVRPIPGSAGRRYLLRGAFVGSCAPDPLPFFFVFCKRNYRAASASSCSTPLPDACAAPRSHCASAALWSAALRHKRAASVDSRPTPKPCVSVCVHLAEIALKLAQFHPRSHSMPPGGLCRIVSNVFACPVPVPLPKNALGQRTPLLRGFAVQHHGLGVVLLDVCANTRGVEH